MRPQIPSASPKEEADNRHRIYMDVEGLITPGFLSQQVVVSGIQIAMKSLSPGEMFLLHNRVGLEASSRDWSEWMIASSVWMVGGQVLIGDVNAPVVVRGMLETFPKSALDKLHSVFTALHNRVQKALSRVEAYCYEDYGRANWRMLGRGSPARDDIAGVPGVSSLGLNHVQRLWVAYNLAEDDRAAWNLEWAAAKLIASAASPKGVKKLNQKDDADRSLEESRRKTVIQRSYYEATGLRVGEESGMVVYRAVSPEELADEMNRWAHGERDAHDKVIESYKAKIRERHEQDRAAHEARMQELANLQEEAAEAGIAPLVGYTIEQLRELRGASGAPLQRRGTPVATSSGTDRLYDKYVASEIPVGGLTDGGRAKAMPSGADPKGLSEAVSGRQVRLTDDGGGS